MESDIEGLVIDDALGFVVNRAALIMKKRLTYLLKQDGYHVTPEEFAILNRLWEEDGLFQSVINDRTLKDKTTVTRLLEKLVKKGLIQKKNDELDRRNYKIYLTEQGMALKHYIIPLALKMIEKGVRNIDNEDLRITINTLKKLYNNLNAEDEL